LEEEQGEEEDINLYLTALFGDPTRRMPPSVNATAFNGWSMQKSRQKRCQPHLMLVMVARSSTVTPSTLAQVKTTFSLHVADAY
jgi:hypothetical protein